MDNLDAANDDGPGELAGLRKEFRGFRIWREITGDRVRYVARSQFPGLNPHTVVTADAAELRAALEPAREAALVPLSTTTASIARIYDYLLGGKDNHAADRAAAARILETFPEAGQIAQANRAFQARAILHAARQGIGQFLDLGAGLPASPSTHEAARRLSPAARVVYVDCDELVLAHARALLAVDEQIAVVGGDIRDPGGLLADPALTGLIDLAEPVCVLLVSVLHFMSADEADAVVAAFRDWMAPGSCLVISAGTSTGTDPQVITALQEAYRGTALVTGRSEAAIAAWFSGLTLARPGLVDVWAWRPDSLPRPARPPSMRVRFLGGVARKPRRSVPWQP